MAYLTEYSYNQLIERIEIKEVDRIDREFFKTNIFDNDYLYFFFNQFELKKLFKQKILLSNEKSYILTHREVPKRKDNLNYILEIRGNVKYHKNNECEALGRGFKNFFMPESVVRLKQKEEEEEDKGKKEKIKNKHTNLVAEIRDWFQRNNYTIKRYENCEINDKILTTDFNKIFPEKYDIEPISISQSNDNQFKWFIEKKSTGHIETEKSFDYNKFLNKITELIKRRDFLCNGKTMQSLARYDFLLNRNNEQILSYIIERINKGYLKNVSYNFFENYGIDKIKKFWSSNLELKYKAIEQLLDYFKWSYNFKDDNFDEAFLEDFNLKPCNICYQNKVDIEKLI